MELYPNLILDALRTVRYPGTGKDIVEMGMVEDDIRIDGNRVSFSLIFKKATDPFLKSIVKACETAINTHISPDIDIKGNIAIKTPSMEPKPKAEEPLPGVKNIIGVSSGKGGVGKSTVACNLAVALAQQGYRVGLLDADIFGPSIPKMLGIEDEQLYMEEIDGKKLIVPAEKFGVKTLSIGFVVDKEQAVLWRGAMASNALKQLITEAHWGASHTGANSCYHRGYCGHHTTGSGASRRSQGGVDVHGRARERASARHRGEHVVVHSCRSPRREVLHLRS